jgi:asparagine synthase (glutamine-hydrolysing)
MAHSGVCWWTSESKRWCFFNDRYGINRLYFHKNEHGFYFSSEAKALLGVLPHARALDPTSLGEVFSCGCVLQNRTIFRGISLMPGGSAWTFRPGEDVRKEYYFSKELWEQQPTLSEAEYYERMKDTWKRILPRYFRGDERMALSLTGGVDSRMILAWAGRAAGTLPCYTFGGQYRECADVRISRQVAGLCGQPHEVLQVGNEFLGQFSSLAAQTVYLSDGTMDVTGAIDLYVQQAARDIAAVRITGTNGGEILRSIVAFKPMPLCESVFDTEFLQHFRSAAATYAKELQCHHLSFTAFKQAAWHMASKFVVERSGLILRMPYFDNDLVKLVYQAPPESTASNDVSLRLIADGNPALANIGTDRGIALKSKPGVGRARNLFQEFLFKTEYAYDYGMPQWLARLDHALAPLRLERLFLGRHKFHHFRVFYRDELSGYLREVLLDPRSVSRSYLHRSGVEKILNGHLKGNRNYTLEIHKL